MDLDLNTLTIRELKELLVENNIPLPPVGSPRFEYIGLYRSHVAERDASEEEYEVEIDPWELSDEELFSKLRGLGVDVGPVVDTTREFYRKWLKNQLTRPRTPSSPLTSPSDARIREFMDMPDQEAPSPLQKSSITGHRSSVTTSTRYEPLSPRYSSPSYSVAGSDTSDSLSARLRPLKMPESGGFDFDAYWENRGTLKSRKPKSNPLMNSSVIACVGILIVCILIFLYLIL